MKRLLIALTLLAPIGFAVEGQVYDSVSPSETRILAELQSGFYSRLEDGLTDGLYLGNYVELGVHLADKNTLSYRQEWDLFIGDDYRKDFNTGFLGGFLSNGFIRYTQNAGARLSDETQASFEVRQYLPVYENASNEGFITATELRIKLLSARAGIAGLALELRPRVNILKDYDASGIFFANELRVGAEFQMGEKVRVNIPVVAYSQLRGNVFTEGGFNEASYGGLYLDPSVEMQIDPMFLVGARFETFNFFSYGNDFSYFDFSRAIELGIVSAYLRVAL